MLLDLLNENNYEDFEIQREQNSVYHCLLLLHPQISKDQILIFAGVLLSFEYLGRKLEVSFL